MAGSRDRPYAWVFYLTAGLLCSAVVLRTLLTFTDDPLRTQAVALLALWAAMFVSVEAFGHTWRGWFPIYLVLASAGVVLLISRAESADFFAVLFAVEGAQVMQRYGGRVGAAALCLFVPVIAVPLYETHSLAETIVLTLTYSAFSILLGSYGLAARRATAAREQTQALVRELGDMNGELQTYSEKLERLAVARERQRLMRDLHDSVTQTIFSMTLTTQSALLLLDRDPARVGGQLERLAQLTRQAQSEMRTLVSELRPENEEAGLVTSLRRHLAARTLPEELDVSLDVQGEQRLSPAEERNLFRIAQEALNNVAKHAGSSRAFIHLRLEGRPSMEIADEGRGFRPARERVSHGLGLDGMRSRAREIGWSLRILSAPGAGTRVIVEKDHEQGESG